ncbi:peptidase M61 [uncultured Aquabacterium sp.]|jgi:predicted metalloprotease with PDZ domain|uniref:M61 family metallopeptidase n=1 Tax=uncultured Aquabacterium sp. TaxID=158753 RepID=UPI00262D5A74|nr:peptidase M61 [uncultured Aquabacterium sp.]
MIDYRIEVGDAHAHRFVVTLKVAQPAAEQVFSLPVWIPGSYLVREFARHLSPIAATQGGQPCDVSCLDKASWMVRCAGRGALTLRYEVYAFDTSVRAAFLDASRGFFNGTSVFLKAHGLEAQPHRVKITGLPRGWSVATSLPSVKVNALGVGDYVAADYDELIDHPVELGTFWKGTFTVRGVQHDFVVAGAPADLDGQRLLDDTRKVCEAQIAFWHGRRKAPFQHYVFMLNAVEDGYGGLEHRASTALICSRKDLPRQGRPLNQDAYTTLLGLISHEYFHTWNVKRLKPVAFDPYELSRENPTRMLWFFEGFTSYYDDQFLLRTGLIDAATYLKLLARTVNLVLAAPGRLQYSVGQASFDAWTRYYRQDENTANATVNYYTKGSLVALALDLSLRALPERDDAQFPSLDGVMRRLWALGRAITEADVAQALADEAGAPPQGAKTADALAGWQTLLHAWTEGTGDLPLPQLLSEHGVAWSTKAGSMAQQLGVKLSESGGALKVQAVMHGGAGEEAGLSAGDELLALAGWRLRKADDLTTWHDASHAQPLLLARDGRVLTVSLPALQGRAPSPAAADVVTLMPADKPQPEALQRRRAWLTR